MSAVDDVFTYLGPSPGQALAGAGTGWALVRRYMGDPPEFTDQAVVVGEDGGPPPEIKAAAGIGNAAVQDPGVLVMVRAKARDSDVTKAKAAAIFAALHGKLNIQLVASGITYYRVRALTPEPVFAGFDETGRPRHTIAFRLLTAAA
jgi:hypothetical protein